MIKYSLFCTYEKREDNSPPREGVAMWLIVFVWCLNLGISIWNVYVVGSAWVEAKHAGGWHRFMAWMGAIMADVGFTWCSILLFGFGAYQLNYLNEYWLEVLFSAGYVVLIPVALFSGYAITFNSWQIAYRERSLSNVGVTAWNTYASFHNTYNAMDSFGEALGKVLEAFAGGKNKKDGQAILVLLILIFSIGLGTLITWVTINRLAGRDEPLPLRSGGSLAR